MRTKTRVSTKTKVAVAVGTLAIAAAAGSFAAMRPAGTGLTIIANHTGETEFVKNSDDFELLSFSVKARGADLNIVDLNFEIIADDDSSFSTIENDISAADHLTDCKVVNTSNGGVLMGPLDPTTNTLLYTDDFTAFQDDKLDLALTCDFLNIDPENLEDDIFAARIIDRNDISYKNSTTGISIPSKKTQFGMFNMGVNARAKQASVRLIEYSSMTASLSSASPSGAQIPGMIEVLRFNLSAEESSSAYVDKFMFEIHKSDESESGWSNCYYTSAGSGLTSASFELYNLSTGSTSSPLTGSIALAQGDGTVCSVGDLLQYVTFDPTLIETIPAGETYVYSLYMDATGASAVEDDILLIEIPSQSIVESLSSVYDSITWTDDGGTHLDGDNVQGLPLVGSTLQF